MRTFTLLFLFATVTFAQEDSIFIAPSDALQDPDFSVQGEYVGSSRSMQVIALGEGDFDVVVYPGGLPGAGWNRTDPQRLQLDADEVLELADSNGMKRIERTSPTLGMKPPEGAIHLFDGSRQSLERHWQAGANSTDDGLLEPGATSRDRFQDFILHVEFRTPFKPKARGQARGNSGVYFQGRYETQVLDSFGLAGKMNETGGIYSIRDPDVNMCFPPLTWQTYDAIFTAARFDASGKKVADARLTVRLNGVVVQQDVALTHATTAAPWKEGPEPGPIFLQDHGNPVRFRNIWVQPRDVAKEARRPVVPGWERFFSSSENEVALGGRILISELGCVACHPSNEPDLVAKQAPILDDVGGRIRADYLLEHISNPHVAQPGSTMPVILQESSPNDRQEAARAIASFLMTTGETVDRPGHPKSAARGSEIFHSVGCTACHTPQDASGVALPSDVPLESLDRKYTLDSLTGFLRDPHAVRPSGRMPALLDNQKAADVATYLLREAIIGDSLFNMDARFYKGNWETLPDFDELEPNQQTGTYGLDLQAFENRSRDRFGARFDSYFFAPRDDLYRFHLGSDDGSRLYIDGQLLIDNDGIHAMQWRSEAIRLAAGVHSVRVDYFEQAGGEELELEVEGAGISRMPFETLATLDKNGKPSKPVIEAVFEADPQRVDSGRELYRKLGCAACHQLSIGGQAFTATREYLPLGKLREEQGCLSDTIPQGLPDYELSPSQRAGIQAALIQMRQNPTQLGDEQHIHASMLSLNCYACHRRAGFGGPILARDVVFQTTMREMGDEGRIPPPLDGVGDKLQEVYLRKTLADGANERSYMQVNMPGFGSRVTEALADAFIRSDQRSEVEIERAEEPIEQTKNAGRLLAGNKGLACIKCHTANGQGTGIRAIDLLSMTSRLREDWFHRYLMNPTEYRPGTRMPASFPDGVSVLPELYDGSPSLQLNALWQYLSDGSSARIPIGAEASLIELAATEQPVIYRNFLDGLSPRGIGVGYPEGLNIAWDANTMGLAQIWKGAFIDASKHWIGRGPGNQIPLGDQVLPLESNSPIAIMDSVDAQWPTDSARNRGYQFLGYRLTAGRPTFRYRVDQVEVTDTPQPAMDPVYGPILEREFTITGASSQVVLNVASGKDIRVEGDWYIIDDLYAVRVRGDVAKVVHNGVTSLRIPVELVDGTATIVQQIRW